MDFKSLLNVVVFASIITSILASCDIRNIDYERCNYTVVCSTNGEVISRPICYSEAYVTFIITNSIMNHLDQYYLGQTNFGYDVREFSAHGNIWNNIDSSAFGYQLNCIRIDISNNNIVNLMNDAFQNLDSLQYLNISNNNIEKLSPNSFRIRKSSDNRVQELDLSYNKLTELFGEVNQLPDLKKLHLQNNMLTKMADDTFTSLKTLNYLNLQNNHLTFLNLTLINLKMLKTLDVSYNHLMKLSGYEINRLFSIIDFNASHNALTEVESNCFNRAFFVQKVDFSHNNISMNILNVMFTKNIQLNYLNFYNNNITGIQGNSFKRCNLDYVNFENNNITGDIKENTFTGLHNVTKLDLSRQSISGIRNNAFIDTKNLLYLNLSINNIGVVENSSFFNTSITVLDLSHNKVSHLNFLQNCLTNLTEFKINNNIITVIPKYVFDSQTQLEKLDLSMNRIQIIEQYSLPLKNLQYISIKGNHLSGTISKNVFSPAKYLRFLDLADFNITKIDELAFVDLNLLARLNLSNNQIETIDSNNFKGVDNMYSLDLSHNNLMNVTINNSILTNTLKALYLNNNNLTNVSGLFYKKRKKLYLDVSNNKIENPSKIVADILPNLTVLHLDNNKIKNFNNPEINSLTTLTDLRLSSNEVGNINLSYFKELMSVDLSNNKLNYLNSMLLKNNEYLQSLDVSRNNINDLPPGTFQFMKSLKLLNLSSNYLTELRFYSLKGLHKTELLDLSRNKIAVLDVDVFYECNELKTLIIDYNRIKSFDVERFLLMSLWKLRTLSLGGNPIACTEIVHNMKSANVTLYPIRHVEVTSIDKIYHEDNVHGIQCGDHAFIYESTTVKSDLIKPTGDTDSSVSSTSIVLAWCSILTALLVASGVVAYIKLYKKRVLAVVSSNMTMQITNSLDLDGSDFQSDLLS